MHLTYLILGGALGTLARYGISLFSLQHYYGQFPLGTFIVNLLGSLLIGFFWGFWNDGHISVQTKLFLFVGFFGGFTTFSSFALEALQLLKNGYSWLAIFYILLTNLVGIACVFGGYFTGKSISQ